MLTRNLLPVGLCSLLLAACASESDTSSNAIDLAVRADAKPGDRIEREGAAVEVPPRGTGVYAEMLFMDGHTSVLDVETTADGEVHEVAETPLVSHDPESAEPEMPDASFEPEDEESDAIALDSDAMTHSSPSACSDSAYRKAGFKWTSTLNWYFESSSVPSELSVTSAENAFKASIKGITISRNDCGFSDQVGATQVYKGRTSRGTQVRNDGTCGASDGVNVVQFGTLPSGILGITCTWYSNGVAQSSDIRLNKRNYVWYTSKPANCSKRFSVHSVLTHEAGHAFGLGHVSESSHGNLTMSTAIPPCSGAAYTLGKGDVLGLRAIY